LVADEIIITGSRISSSDFYDIPSVALEKKADFLLQKVRLSNDSRDPKLRIREVITTINDLLRVAKKTKGISLSYGEGFLTPVKINDGGLKFISDGKREDANHVDIYVKVRITKDVKKQIKKLTHFISNAKLHGRTEIDEMGDIGISINNPQQYRYDIIQKVADENDKIRKILGSECQVVVHGLEGRVQWERISLSELMLYIGYSLETRC